MQLIRTFLSPKFVFTCSVYASKTQSGGGGERDNTRPEWNKNQYIYFFLVNIIDH